MTRMLAMRPRDDGATLMRAKAAATARPVVARACAVLACVAFVLMPAGMASGADTQTPARGRTVMILLDNNSSEAWVALARRSALAYAHALSSDVSAGLMTFATSWHLVMRPTTDRTRLDAAISAVQGATGSYYNSEGIYTALSHVTSSVPRLRAAGSRLLVISDAENLVGPDPAAAIPADVIAQRGDSDDNTGKLSPLAASSGGRLAGPRRAAALATAAFGRSPNTPSPSPRTHRPKPKPQAASGTATARGPWPLVAGIAALFAAVFLIVVSVLGSAARAGEERDLAGRIRRYGPQNPSAAAADEAADAPRASRAALSMTKRLMTPAAQEHLAERLDLAGVARKPAEWALLGACLGVVVAAALSLVTSYVLFGVLAGALIGWLAMRVSLSMRIVRRRSSFGEQLPDMLQLIASALRAGFSLAQAIDAVVREDVQPIAGEISRALSEVRLGGNLEDGLDAVANRMDSDDLRWTVTAIRIQQGVGGNLAEILLTIAGTIRERAFLRRHVRALSAEGRLSAYVLIALPVLIGIWLFVSASQYMRPLYTTPIGELLFGAAIVSVVLGAFWMRKMINIKI
jgi:tight adherence protein B